MYRLCGGIVAAIVGVGVCVMLAQAQPPAPQPAETLFVLARIEGERTMKELKTDFSEAVRASGATSSPVEEVKVIPAALYYQLDAVIRNAAAKAGSVTRSIAGAELRQLPSNEARWEYRPPNTKMQLLQELTVHFKKAGSVKYVSKAKDAKEKEFELIERGRYALPLLPDDYPTKYSAKLLDRGTEQSIDDAGPWPAEERFIMITIRDFRGEKKRLFDSLKDSKVMGNPLKELQEQEGFAFVFASFGSDSPDSGEIIVGNKYPMTVGKLKDLKPARVWVYFPLTKEEAEKKAAELNAMEREDVSKQIRSNGPSGGMGEAQIDISKGAQWIELPDQGFGQPFGRTFNLGELAPFAGKYPNVYQVAVWEFDTPTGTSYAIRTGGKFSTVQELKALSTAIEKTEKSAKP